MVNLRLLQLLTVHIATKIKYQIMSKTSTIDFVEAFCVYRLFAFIYCEFEVRIVAVPRTGRKLSAYAPLVPLLILKLVSLLEQKRKIIKLWACK